ncbi:MAG: M61 family peptidase [Oscillatoriales cyanobacterium]|nr:MAG: M61 family peptidase [Oscillatoriales cyanobacterium]
MTQAISAPNLPSIDGSQPRIGYRIAMPEPTNHLFDLTLTIDHWDQDTLDLKLPVWTPGSYLVREYAKHLQDFQAFGADGFALVSEKRSKNHWRVHTPESQQRSSLTIHYRLFANDLTVRTNHLDRTHGFIVGAATFFRIPGLEHLPIALEVIPPDPAWALATTLLPLEAPEAPDHATDPTRRFRLLAPDFDTLIDSPIEIGIHHTLEFEAIGKPHRYAIWGNGNGDFDQIVADTIKIIECEAALFDGELPYDRYLFLLHRASNHYGGLEHKDSCVLSYPPLGLRDRDQYRRFIQLVAHEFFHLWNVKRLRPKALERFDYDQENYTPSLWFCEGVTCYYDLLVPLWAGVYNFDSFLTSLSKDITGYLLTPGRLVQPLSESSWDAWIKLYRRDSNSDNSQISYYTKGMMVALLLDLKIRLESQNQRSLNDLLRALWEKFGRHEIGYTPEDLFTECEAIAQCDLSSFFHCYLHSTEELPLQDYLEPFGLTLQPKLADVPYFGVRIAEDPYNRALVQFVATGSPAQIAGIDPNDELIALNGYRVTAKTFNEQLKNYRSGETIDVTLFHHDELVELSITLDDSQPIAYRVKAIESPTAMQVQNRNTWLRLEPKS